MFFIFVLTLSGSRYKFICRKLTIFQFSIGLVLKWLNKNVHKNYLYHNTLQYKHNLQSIINQLNEKK